MLWYLWSRNRREAPEGTYSHETAVSLHNLSDIMPSRLQLTVPKRFRRNSRLPEILELHRADLAREDFQEMHGVRVTRPLRTIADLLRTGRVDRGQLRKAIEEGLRRGLFARKEIDTFSDREVRNEMRKLVGRAR
jgi:predicted transcriptional regulator of viral defense system